MLTQKQISIYQLQNALRTLHFAGMILMELIPDGIYGEQTKKAVMEFQEKFRLPITGICNYETWREIMKEYTEITD
jgi:peptidoglycan hydrolase-like protein with peptidoglycan-binding domain